VNKKPPILSGLGGIIAVGAKESEFFKEVRLTREGVDYINPTIIFEADIDVEPVYQLTGPKASAVLLGLLGLSLFNQVSFVLIDSKNVSNKARHNSFLVLNSDIFSKTNEI
jgi:hypothetical protein